MARKLSQRELNEKLLAQAGVDGVDDPEAVLRFIARGAQVNCATGFGWTPLHYAVFSGNIGVCRALLENGADIEGKCEDGWTALNMAVYHNGDREMVLLLLESGANPAAVNKQGMQPLHYMARDGNAELAALLLEFGAPVDCCNENGKTPGDLCKDDGIRALLGKTYPDARSRVLSEIARGHHERMRRFAPKSGPRL